MSVIRSDVVIMTLTCFRVLSVGEKIPGLNPWQALDECLFIYLPIYYILLFLGVLNVYTLVIG